jgi:hypothetical protein
VPYQVAKRLPAFGNLSGDANAPAMFWVVQLALSAFNSAVVGTRYPLGQGLFMPFTPCHKLSFCGLRQSWGEFAEKIKLP